MAADLAYTNAFFHCPQIVAVGEEDVLPAAEARHATGARRLREGDSLMLFDGAGTLASVKITVLDPRGRSTRFVVESRESVPAPERRVGLIAAVPKGDRQHTLLDMATQLGVTDYWPLISERSVTKPVDVADRWRRVVVEACKQSRRPWLPALHAPIGLDDGAGQIDSAAVLVLDPDGASVDACLNDSAASVVAVIGPEGGFTDAEKQQLRDAGARAMRVGPHVLRTETAAIAAVAAITSH